MLGAPDLPDTVNTQVMGVCINVEGIFSTKYKMVMKKSSTLLISALHY